MSVIEQTEQKKKSEKVTTTLLRKDELYKHFWKNVHMKLSIPRLQVQYSKL